MTEVVSIIYDSTLSPFEQGHDANRYDGMLALDNPYTGINGSTQDFFEWQDGWYAWEEIKLRAIGSNINPYIYIRMGKN